MTKLSSGMVGTYTKWVLELGAGSHIDWFLHFMANKVNPQELNCSVNWYDWLCTNIPKTYPFFRLNLAISQHTTENRKLQVRPAPDACGFITESELVSLGKNTELLEMVNTFLGNTRDLCEDKLVNLVGKQKAMDVITEFEVQMMRYTLKKPFANFFHPGVTGKIDEEKMMKLRGSWMEYLENSSPALTNFGVEVGIHTGSGASAADEDFCI